MVEALLCAVALLSAADAKYLEWVAGPPNTAKLPESSGQRLTAAELTALARADPQLPFTDPIVGIRDQNHRTWVGCRQGLMLLAPGAERWRLFHSRRWLPSDDVQDLAVTDAGEVYVQTPAGIGELAQRETTLEQKMAEIDATLQKHHLRDGIVGAIHLHESGRLDAGHAQHSNDNDGLWTSLYVAAEAFRYGATGDPSARQSAKRSLDAMLFLERITGILGFAARSVVPIDEVAQTHHGEWHRSADNRWWWKGDTSSDEVDGHYFAYLVYYNTAADDREKQEIRDVVARITDHILDHGLYYVGPPGTPTTWGVWAPEKLNHDLRRAGDRGLNSLEILSHLKVAEYIVGKPRYTAMIKELIERHAYEMNTVFQKHTWPSERVNHSDDELAFLAYYPLLILERDPDLRTVYLASLKRTWLIERPERSPLFNLIYGAALQASIWTDPAKRPNEPLADPAEYDHDPCVEWFRDVPADTIHWTVTNSQRRDIGAVSKNRFGRTRAHIVLPVSERSVMRWNGDPYTLDGGSEGRARDDGAAILLPYWMGRYHRLIDP